MSIFYTSALGDASIIVRYEPSDAALVSTIGGSFMAAAYSAQYSLSTSAHSNGEDGVDCPEDIAVYYRVVATTLATRSELLTVSTSAPADVTFATPTPTLTTDSASSEAGDTIVGVVDGAVGGCSAFFIAVFAILVLCLIQRRRRRRRRRRQRRAGGEGPDGVGHDMVDVEGEEGRCSAASASAVGDGQKEVVGVRKDENTEDGAATPEPPPPEALWIAMGRHELPVCAAMGSNMERRFHELEGRSVG